MTGNSWWQRLDAERWIYRLGMTVTAFLVLLTLWTALVWLGEGLVLLALAPAAFAALSGWLTAAWRRGRTWSWWVSIVLAGSGAPAAVGDFATAPSVWNAVGLAINLGVLALLCHPRSRARIHGPVPALPTTAEYALAGRGR